MAAKMTCHTSISVNSSLLLLRQDLVTSLRTPDDALADVLPLGKWLGYQERLS